uniref:Putative salivary cysteine-rich protein n=1 Tax=Corethrella appendiculata TaxID=1370023 RepID=U5ESJ3_9DIPT
MAKLFLYFTVIVALVVVIEDAAGQGSCPLSSQVTSCSPKCLQDTDCTSIGGKCCPNLCNYKSCVLPKSGSNAQGSKYQVGGSGASGSYCGNVKCNSYEKCELEKASKRQKCVRA